MMAKKTKGGTKLLFYINVYLLLESLLAYTEALSCTGDGMGMLK